MRRIINELNTVAKFERKYVDFCKEKNDGINGGGDCKILNSP